MNFFVEIKEGLLIAWDAIRANKMRSVLTTLGIVIGIVTVTLMGTAIDGMNRAFRKSISIIGADMLYVNRSAWLNHSEADWL
ncbi:MAG: transporter efflux protein, partial [Pedosphaera sp.]|nr:transporter efflux protein [Pedosphaera sp.]